MRFKVGDKVRVKKDLAVGKDYGGCTFTISMEEYKGDIHKIKHVYPRGTYDLGNYFNWADEMLEEVRENKMEKDFREVIADIKEGEVWESSSKYIELFNDGIKIRHKDDTRPTQMMLMFDDDKFKLKRKEYTFQEAFKAYEEGKEIEDFDGTKYKKIDGVDCYKFEYHSDFRTKVDEDDYWLGFKEIRGAWYINN